MKKNIRYFSFILFIISLLLNFLSSKYPYIVEKYYTRGINKKTIEFISQISRIFPLSIFEITIYLILLITLFIISYIIYTIIFSPSKLIFFIKSTISNFLNIILILYSLFIILWGLNYNKLPLDTILIENSNSNLSNIHYDIDDLKTLYKFLVEKTNEYRELVSEDDNGIMKLSSDYNDVISTSQLGFNNISDKIPNLDGNYGHAKYVLSSKLMCYTGITGIYSPFTGEANLNIAIPDSNIPSTLLHEMSHQRGYANEDEANFIAYLSCINHPNVDFIYSGYRLALSYTGSTLRQMDINSYNSLSSKLSDKVILDSKYNINFWQSYDGKVDDISSTFNNYYLKANGVKDGIKSYNKMVNLLLIYYNIYGY